MIRAKLVGFAILLGLSFAVASAQDTAAQSGSTNTPSTPAAQASSTNTQATTPANQATGTKPSPTQEPAASPVEPGPEKIFIDFGTRNFWGDVYGRPDLPFVPNLRYSKLNEYGDIRNNFYIRRAHVNVQDFMGTQMYFLYQTMSPLYRDQSHLVTFGEYDKFKLQFRYDEIPHIYSNTTRTIYTQVAPGILTVPGVIKQGLQTASSTGTAAQISNNLPGFIANQLVPSEQFIIPQITRKAGTLSARYNFTPNWAVLGSFFREHESGNRPIGAIFNNSPSASASSSPGTVANRQSPGTGVELPESIDYYSNRVNAMAEYGRNRWAVQFGYNGSFFEVNIPFMLFDNPFATANLPVQLIPPGNGCTPTGGAVNCSIQAVPAQGRMATYPNNQANYLNFSAVFDLTKYVHVSGMVMPGWQRQNDPFLPYTANTAITGLAPLPAASLGGNRQTLAMNWTLISRLAKQFQIEARYRQYDLNNNTPVFTLTPIEGDTIGANATATAQAAPTEEDTDGRSNPGYNRRTLELNGDWFFMKRSTLRVGWSGEWFDRSHRDVDHSFAKSVLGTLDFSPLRSLMVRVQGSHTNRTPDEYQDPTASDPITGAPITCTSTSVVFTETQRCARRFDEAARLLDTFGTLVEYNLARWNFSGSFDTKQSNFNLAGGVNSPTPLNFLSGTTKPYFNYGLQKDIGWVVSFDTTYAISPAWSGFLEYTHENYYTRMISRSRTPTSGTQTILTCTGCDTPNNDWESTTVDIFDTYGAGFDFFFKKRLWFTPYYTLAAGHNNVFSRALGNPTITTGPNAFVLTGNSTPQNYPEATTRIHEAVIVLKYKISNNLTPRFEYRFQQYDNQDYQTTPMTPFMGCIGTGSIVVTAPCVNVPNLVTSVPSPFYPGFVVGDTAAARYIFLGADQPSYRAHVITATLEYHW